MYFLEMVCCFVTMSEDSRGKINIISECKILAGSLCTQRYSKETFRFRQQVCRCVLSFFLSCQADLAVCSTYATNLIISNFVYIFT
jgi:hypothetical protein